MANALRGGTPCRGERVNPASSDHEGVDREVAQASDVVANAQRWDLHFAFRTASEIADQLSGPQTLFIDQRDDPTSLRPTTSRWFRRPISNARSIAGDSFGSSPVRTVSLTAPLAFILRHALASGPRAHFGRLVRDQ